ncbi:MAG: glycosyltransferase [Nitrospiraceae bacterium]|nr:MAG: glycosyltransferase [Nitrospiraceae bacterium]
MVFEKNIHVLRQRDSILADEIIQAGQSADINISKSKSGLPTLRIKNIYVHSLYNPQKEAEEWVKSNEQIIASADNIVVFGFGLGYHLSELCKHTDKDITVFEPDPNTLKASLCARDLRSVLSRIKIVTDNAIPYFDGEIVVLTLPSSVKLFMNYYDHVLSRMKSRDIINQGLRIMVVGPVYGGSLEVARYCSSSLIRMGHTVELVDNSRFDETLFYIKEITNGKSHYNALVEQFTHLLSKFFLARCELFQPDIIIALAQAPVTTDCVERIRQYGVKTAYWFVEDYRLMEYWKHIAGSFDHFFTIQKDDFFKKMKQSGLNNYHYLPMAAFPDVHKPVDMFEDEKKYYGSDISFVGAGYYNRKHFFSGLIDHDLKIWGNDWDMRSKLAGFIQRSGSRIDTREIVRIFNASNININLHSSTYHKGVNPFGDFINPRTFEIASCGGFQLVDRRSNLAELFNVDDEIVVFDDLDDIRNKIKHYLENPDEAERIAENGRKRVLRDHTYEKRMEEMLDVIVSAGYESAYWKNDREPVKKLISEAGRETDLGTYLSGFSDQENINLTDIKDRISNEDGVLSRTETIFLMMKELTG